MPESEQPPSTLPAPENNQYRRRLNIAFGIYLGVFTIDIVATCLYLSTPGTKENTWSLFQQEFLAILLAVFAYTLGSRKLLFRFLLHYTFVLMTVWIPVMLVNWRMLDRMMGKRSWFEFEYGPWGERIKRCEHGTELSCDSILLPTKSILAILNFMVFFVQGAVNWGLIEE
ncbi:hypothetical protein BGZ82_004633 [Podila clonocystis]|nr:hypothetical protein BGZ82_004633 [Podila clonocystis]